MADENLIAPNTDPLANQNKQDPQTIKRNLDQLKKLAKQASQIEIEEEEENMGSTYSLQFQDQLAEQYKNLGFEDELAEFDPTQENDEVDDDLEIDNELKENDQQDDEDEDNSDEQSINHASALPTGQTGEASAKEEEINKSINQKRQQEADEPENSEAEEQTQEQDSAGPQYGLMATMKRLQNGKACGSPTGCIGTLGRMFLDFVGAFYLYVIGDKTVGKEKTDCCISCGCCCNCLVHILILFAPAIILIFIGAMGADLLGGAFDWVMGLFS